MRLSVDIASQSHRPVFSEWKMNFRGFSKFPISQSRSVSIKRADLSALSSPELSGLTGSMVLVLFVGVNKSECRSRGRLSTTRGSSVTILVIGPNSVNELGIRFLNCAALGGA